MCRLPWCQLSVSSDLVGARPSQKEIYGLLLGRQWEQEELSLNLLFLNCRQLKISLIPKWHILSKTWESILRKFSNMKFRIYISDAKCISTDPTHRLKVFIQKVCQSEIYPLSTWETANLIASTMTLLKGMLQTSTSS